MRPQPALAKQSRSSVSGTAADTETKPARSRRYLQRVSAIYHPKDGLTSSLYSFNYNVIAMALKLDHMLSTSGMQAAPFIPRSALTELIVKDADNDHEIEGPDGGAASLRRT